LLAWTDDPPATEVRPLSGARTVALRYGASLDPTTFHAMLDGERVSPAFHPEAGAAETVTLDFIGGRNHLVLQASSTDGLTHITLGDLFGVFNDAGLDVMRNTRNEQQPWVSNSPIQGKFHFTPPAVATVSLFVDESVLPKPTPNPPPQVMDTEVVSSTGASLDYIQEAYILLGERKFTQAHRVLAEAKRVDPQSNLSYSYDGFTWFLQAEELAEQAKRAQYSKKSVDAAQALYTKAFAEYDAAIDLDPFYQPTRRHRGVAIMAVNRLMKAAERKTNDQLDRALVDLRDAVRLDPTSKRASTALGVVHILRGEYQQALKAFNAAIELDPKYLPPYAGRCAAYTKLGKVKEAKADAAVAARAEGLQGNCVKVIFSSSAPTSL
jgi:Tfp pilus assembly protein PilF